VLCRRNPVDPGHVSAPRWFAFAALAAGSGWRAKIQ